MEKYDILKKILMIGDSGVGKTCLLLRYVKNEHRIEHLPTVGIDFKMKTIEVNNKKVKLQMWDTAGQERFITITNTFFKGAHGVFLCYSITDRRSFDNVSRWVDQVRELAPKQVNIFLLGNKIDLVDKRKVQYDEGVRLANSMGFQFFEVSAFDGSNVNQAFYTLAEKILHDDMHEKNQSEDEHPTGNQIKKQSKFKKIGCCK